MPVVVGEVGQVSLHYIPYGGEGLCQESRYTQQAIHILFKKNDTLKRDG